METGVNDLQKYKPYLIPGIAALALVALLPLVIMPWISEVNTGFKEIGVLKDTVAAMSAKADALEQMDVAAKKSILERQVEPSIPSQADPSGSLETIQQIARANGLSITSVSYGAAAATAPAAADAGASVSSVATSISMEGTYPAILGFVVQSEKIARVLNINSLHITSEEGGALTLAVDVQAPYQPALTDLGPAEEPLPAETAAITQTLAKVNMLSKASYAPTPSTDIAGKQNPFN